MDRTPEAATSTSSSGFNDAAPLDISAASVIGLSSSAGDDAQPWIPINIDPPQVAGTVLPDDSFLLDDSLFSSGNTLSPSFGP